MITAFRRLFALALFLTLSHLTYAFNFNPVSHMRVYYDFCEEDVVVEFVYFQSAGDNDRMDLLYFKHNPASGQPVTIIDFRHSSEYNGGTFTTLGAGSPTNSFGYAFAPSDGHNWQIIRDALWEENDQEGHKYWVRFILRDLPESVFETFTVGGFWNGQGSASPDMDINMTYPVNMFVPDAPSGFTASQTACGKVVLSWMFDDFDNTCIQDGWTYAFRLYRGTNNNHFAEITGNPNTTSYSYEDPQTPTGTDPDLKTYRLRVVTKKGNAVYQRSAFAGPVAGHPLALPLPPTPPTISYPDCAGAVSLSWQNSQVYDTVIVRLEPVSGPTLRDTLLGSALSTTMTIDPAKTYTATIIGVDACGQKSLSEPVDGVKVPADPDAFVLDMPAVETGAIRLIWNAAPGASSYTVIRQPDNAEFQVGSSTTYLDVDARICTSYSYRIRASNDCGFTMSNVQSAPILEENLDIWSNQRLDASKGYFGNRVELKWSAPDAYGFDKFKIGRRPLGSQGAFQQVGLADKNELQFVDQLTQAGILYEYALTAVSECNGSNEESASLLDIGFRLPVAIINGNVKYEFGTGVDGATVSVERNEGALGKSLHLTPSGTLSIHPDYTADPLAEFTPQSEMSIECWLKPASLEQDFHVFRYAQGTQTYGLRYDANAGKLIQYFSQGPNGNQVAYDANLSTADYNHLSWNRGDGSMHLYLNGVPLSGNTTAYLPANGNLPLTFGGQYTGFLDEIRFWSRSRTAAEIMADYTMILRGDEAGLAAYWRIDEGVGLGVYDISGMEPAFHAKHLRISAANAVSWSDQFPAAHLLGNRAVTDSVGNYSVRNIRYSGTGNLFTVIPFFSPEGTPHAFEPVSTVLFLGEGNPVENGVNFVDGSSFRVTGTILYSLPDSMCFNTKAFIYIDEQVAQVNGEPAAVDENGIFTIDVPIGLHRITVKQSGHAFHHGGNWPEDGSRYDFQKDEFGITFYDSTRVRVIGRVVGGTREAGKKLGFDKSVNNIGQAEIRFVATNGCHLDTVLTDPVSGEYAVDLLPMSYNVFIRVPSNPLLDFGSLDALNLAGIRPFLYEVDTIRNPGGQPIAYDSVGYNYKQNYIYRVNPEVDVTDAITGGPLTGDSLFIYLDPVSLDTVLIPLTGLPWPVYLAGKKYFTTISAFEEYRNFDNPLDTLVDRVPVTDAKVRINNGLGNASGYGQGYEELLEISDPEGKIDYTFFGGQPEFTAEGDPEFDYTQVLDLQLETPSHTVSWREGLPPYRGYVLGVKPDEGSSFITEGPEVVDYILRDPPGDGSTAKFIEGKTYTNTKSWFLKNTNTFETHTKLKLGQRYFFGGGVLGIGFDTHVENDNNFQLEVKTSFDTDGTYVESSTYEQEISTNGDPYFPGDESDIFVGKSQNFLFGGADEFTLVNTEMCDVITSCIGPEIPVGGKSFRLGRRDNLFMVPQGFKTTFVYSQLYIKDYLIPNLTELRNNLFAEPEYQSHLDADDPGFGRNNDDIYFLGAASTLTPESTEIEDYTGPSYTYTPPVGQAPNDQVRWYNQQIRLWEEALGQNEKEKLQAKLVRNISFDAGSSLTYSSAHTSTETYSQRFEVGLTNTSAFVVGGIFAGSGGLFRFTLGIEVATGGSFSEETANTNTYSYTLADRQAGDFFSIDVKDGGHGNGPVFSLRGGQSMCPWERGYTTEYFSPGTELSQSTIRRELPDIDVEPAFQNNVPEHQPARFTLKLRNASPTGDIQWYGLRVLDQANPDGAVLKIDGSSVNRVFEIPAGETLTKVLELYKGEANVHEVKLMLYSTCEYDGFQNGAPIYATDTITVRAEFVPACSPVSILQPVDLWVHNDGQGDTINLLLGDYQIHDPNLESLRIQYKPAYTSVWNGLETFWKMAPPASEDPVIPAQSSYMAYAWNIEELPDGPYDIRVLSHCTNTENDYASPKVTGIIDRLRPHAFGNPQPADGILDPGDEILIQFNESIDPASVSPLDFDIRAVLNGAPLRHETSAMLDGINDYVEIPAGSRLGSHPFTFEVWLKRGTNGAQVLWSQGEKVDSSMAIGFDGSNRLYFRWHDNLVNSTAIITADAAWHHIAVTCNTDRLVNFFHTGEFAGSGLVDSLWNIPGNMVFGKAAWANTGYLSGQIHEARIWRTELTEGSIRTQMLRQLSGVEAGLSLLWPMDEGSGSRINEVVRNRHATLLGNWVVEPSGYSIALQGDDEIAVSAGTMSFDRQTHFTLEWWMKGSLSGHPQTLLSNGRGDGSDGNLAGWCITVAPDGSLQVLHDGQAFTAAVENVLDNNWHHIAIVLNRQGNMNTYMDGQLRTSLFGDAFGEFGGPKLWIGNRGWYNGTVEMHDQYFTGLLDEIRVWNTKMTADHIRATQRNRLAGDEYGLQLYLPFEAYSEIGGIPQLNQSLADMSPLGRGLSTSGNPQFTAEDPNIRLVAPYEKVNFTYSINTDRILITPTIDPLRIEKRTLFISARNIRDLHGNAMAGPITWTAFVNKNQLQWADDELSFEKPEKESLSFTADIVNSGGIELSYEILGLPDWLTCTQPMGTISPLTTKTLHFKIDGDVNIGRYSTDINLLSGQGYNDKLSIDLHVFGVPPTWAFDPHAYPHSMTVVADLDIRGELSEDPLDRVAAYINGEVRGLATPEYIPELDRYLVFMEVYSDVVSGETVTFKAWDASTGTTYAGVNIKVGTQTNLQIPYLANSLVGNAVTPARFIVTNDIIQEIPLNAGWTWISFNVLSSKFNNIDAFFNELNFESNDAIYSQTKNAVYNPSSGWQGNLKNDGLEIRKMYKCDFTYADILRVSGPRVNPDLYPITIAKGWNWIPFLSAERIELNEALSSFAATAGDIVKSQNQVAVYHPTQGWVGTLTSMEPGKGYMLYADKAGTIIFPLMARGEIPFSYVEAVHEQAIKWRSGGLPKPIDGQERNMTVIARLDSEVPIPGKPVIAAMADGVLLDLLPGHRVEGTEDLYYFTLQASGPDRMVYFEVYDAEGQYAGLADEKIYWSADQHLGALEDPYVLHLKKDEGPAFEAYPNPFDELLYVEYEAATTGAVSIRLYDAGGRLVRTVKESVVRPGLQKWTLRGTTSDGRSLVTGVYTVEVIQGDTVLRRQLVRT